MKAPLGGQARGLRPWRTGWCCASPARHCEGANSSAELPPPHGCCSTMSSQRRRGLLSSWDVGHREVFLGHRGPKSCRSAHGCSIELTASRHTTSGSILQPNFYHPVSGGPLLCDAPVLYGPALSQKAQCWLYHWSNSGRLCESLCIMETGQFPPHSSLFFRKHKSQRDKLLSALLLVYFHYEKWAGGMHGFHSGGGTCPTTGHMFLAVVPLPLWGTAELAWLPGGLLGLFCLFRNISFGLQACPRNNIQLYFIEMDSIALLCPPFDETHTHKENQQ